jgi:hypothetical protein
MTDILGIGNQKPHIWQQQIISDANIPGHMLLHHEDHILSV